MSLIEACTVLAILAIVIAAGLAPRVSSASSARLRTAADTVRAEMTLNAARAVMESRDVKLSFKQSSYDVIPGRRGIKSSAINLPAGIVFSEARFGSGGKSSPILNLARTGVSSPGRVVIKSAASSVDRCVITRTLRGLNKMTCGPEAQ